MDFLPHFLWSQLFVKPKYPDHDFTDKVVIVTGANVGLGFEAARHIARLNAKKLIIACRTTSKGEAAKDDIEKSTGRKGAIEVWPLDLSSYESVKAFGKRVSALPRLDVAVENAGMATQKWGMSEGNEQHITTNVISTFLLALGILPKLRETANKFNTTPVLSIVTSETHMFAKFAEKSAPKIFEKLNDEQSASIGDRYPTSKLLEVLYIRELAPALEKSTKPKIILNMVNPGLCHSNLTVAGGDPEPRILTILKALLGRTTEMGSRTLVAGACAGTESHGQYMDNGVVWPVSSWVRSSEGKATAERVYSELNEKLEAIDPGVTGNI